jgi:hypothetical protein
VQHCIYWQVTLSVTKSNHSFRKQSHRQQCRTGSLCFYTKRHNWLIFFLLSLKYFRHQCWSNKEWCWNWSFSSKGNQKTLCISMVFSNWQGSTKRVLLCMQSVQHLSIWQLFKQRFCWKLEDIQAKTSG